MEDSYDINQTLQHTGVKNTTIPKSSEDSDNGYQMFDVLDETFSTQPSNESANTALLLKQYQSQTKKGLQMSSDSCGTYSYGQLSGETTQLDYASRSKESTTAGISTSYDADDNSVATGRSYETGTVNTQDNLEDEMEWNVMLSEILSLFYDVSVHKLGRLLYNLSELSNDFFQKSNQTPSEVLEEKNQEEVKIAKTDKAQVSLTREQQREKLKAELAAMDTETAHKFKMMLLKQKQERQDYMTEKKETRHDRVTEKLSTEVRDGGSIC